MPSVSVYCKPELLERLQLRVHGGSGYGVCTLMQQCDDGLEILWTDSYDLSFVKDFSEDNSYEVLSALYLGIRKFLRELQAIQTKCIGITVQVDNATTHSLLVNQTKLFSESSSRLSALIGSSMQRFGKLEFELIKPSPSLANAFVEQQGEGRSTPKTRIKGFNILDCKPDPVFAFHATVLSAQGELLSEIRVLHDSQHEQGHRQHVLVDTSFLVELEEYKELIAELLDPSPIRAVRYGNRLTPVIGVLAHPIRLKLRYGAKEEGFPTEFRNAFVVENLPCELYVPFSHPALYIEKSKTKGETYTPQDLHSRYASLLD